MFFQKNDLIIIIRIWRRYAALPDKRWPTIPKCNCNQVHPGFKKKMNQLVFYYNFNKFFLFLKKILFLFLSPSVCVWRRSVCWAKFVFHKRSFSLSRKKPKKEEENRVYKEPRMTHTRRKKKKGLLIFLRPGRVVWLGEAQTVPSLPC